MLLTILHPEVAYRDCSHCQRFVYNEETGAVERDQNGEPIPRPSPLMPCRLSQGCAKGTPENQRSLSDRNWQAWRHYRECKAVGAFPDDQIVRQNAAIIADALETAEGMRQKRLERKIDDLLEWFAALARR